MQVVFQSIVAPAQPSTRKLLNLSNISLHLSEKIFRGAHDNPSPALCQQAPSPPIAKQPADRKYRDTTLVRQLLVRDVDHHPPNAPSAGLFRHSVNYLRQPLCGRQVAHPDM
jgi:hypothetical protein